MTVFSIICLTVLNASGLRDTLDSFDYRNSAAARQAWQVTGGLPVEMTDVDDRRVMKIDGNLPDDSHPSRVSMDRKVKLNLEGVGEFTLRVATDLPEATNHVSLYFRSGNGWYSMSAGFRGRGWQTLHFYSSKASIEGKPSGWDKIDTIRVAFWRAGFLDAVFLLDHLSGVRHEIAVVDAGKNADDTETVAAVVRRIEKMLAAEGIGFDRVGEDAVARGALEGRSVAILPYNPLPSNETYEALRKFVDGGGRLFVCYSLSKRLGKLLGFELGKWQRGKRPGSFAEIRFEEDILGMPKSVKQSSWNINAARPVGFNARVVAKWYDDQGKPAGEPAMLLSDRGAYLTHIVLPDDATAKRKMLLATLGRLAPVVWEQVCERRLEEIDHIGHCNSLEELAGFIKENGNVSEAAKGLESARSLLADARGAVEKKQFPQANALVSEAGELLDRAYLLSQPSPTIEARGWWNHSGTGLYPGDWDRALEELSQAGFNMVFPNMLWAG
ncbi:MAG: hypothetical protein JXM70_22050, partial [Pirellulales bacterium]|nr:hypothetical protein [Pirellulales bacterium]